jgi:hypothetical protein
VYAHQCTHGGGPRPHLIVQCWHCQRFRSQHQAIGIADGIEDGSSLGFEVGIGEGMEDGLQDGVKNGWPIGFELGFVGRWEDGIAYGFEDGSWLCGFELDIAKGSEVYALS